MSFQTERSSDIVLFGVDTKMKETTFILLELVLYRSQVLIKQHLQPKHRVFRNDRLCWFECVFLLYLYIERSKYLFIMKNTHILHRGLYRFKKPDNGNRMMN